MQHSTKSARAHETRVELNATPGEVWKAITEPRAIERWFAPKMTVEPGVGGAMVADWGPGIEWKTAIEVWEPNRRLRLVETRDRLLTPEGVDEKLGEACRLVQDFSIESEGGRTVLRLVHSGFGSSDDWDREYEGTLGGWAVCFLRLKEGMERHKGERVHNGLMPAVCRGLTAERAVEMIGERVPEPAEVVYRGHKHLAWLLPDAFLAASATPTKDGAVAYFEYLLFGASEAEASAFEARWRSDLATGC